MADVPDLLSFPAVTADEVRARAEAAGFEVGTLYLFDGEAFAKATPEQCLRVGGIAAGMEDGTLYRCSTDGAFDLTLSECEEAAHAAEAAKAVKGGRDRVPAGGTGAQVGPGVLREGRGGRPVRQAGT